MHELPLMAFTLLLQASVGMTLWLAFLHRHILITSSARPVMRPPLLLAFLAGAVGLLISTLHLGYPLNARHAPLFQFMAESGNYLWCAVSGAIGFIHITGHVTQRRLATPAYPSGSGRDC